MPTHRHLITLALAWGPALALLGGVALLGHAHGVPLDIFLRDPAAIAGAPFYMGAVSNVGVVLWAAAAAVCLFAARLVLAAEPRHPAGRFLLASALLSALMFSDDLFQFHEQIAPLHLGVGEKAVLATYGLLGAAYLLAFRGLVFRSDWTLLALALACFATSVGIDQLASQTPSPAVLFAEDGSKFLGISTWLAYLSATASACVRQALAPASAEGREGVEPEPAPRGVSVRLYPPPYIPR